MKILNCCINDLNNEILKFLKSYLINYNVFFNEITDVDLKNYRVFIVDVKFEKKSEISGFKKSIFNEKRIIFFKVLNKITLLSKIVSSIIKCFNCFRKIKEFVD